MNSATRLPSSTPDLTQQHLDSKSDVSSSGSCRSSHSSLHRSSPAENVSRRIGEILSSGDCGYTMTPLSRSLAVSPRHNRSLSFRSMKRPTYLQLQGEDSGFRPRVSTMPTYSASKIFARSRLRHSLEHRNVMLSPPINDHQVPDGDEDDDYYLLRSFSITSKGSIVNRGDFFRQRSRSNNSVASTGSSITTGGNASYATSSSSGQWREAIRKVAMLGSEGVGKTALIAQFMTSEYVNTYESQEDGINRCISVLLDDDEFELLFVDEGDSADAKQGTTEETDAFIVVYSVTERGSFEAAIDILFGLREKSIPENKAVILVGNKSDLARSRQVSIEEGKSTAHSYECKFIETSAGINHNVDELLVGVVSQIRLKFRRLAELQDSSSPSNVVSTKGAQRTATRAKKILSKLLGKGEGRSKSCDNLYVL